LTREDLLKNDIKTVQDLNVKFPAFRNSDVAKPAWIPVPADAMRSG